jgi:hypothetical protein
MSSIRGWRALGTSSIAITLLGVKDAYAHLVSTELGPFYDGAAHALVSPEDLLTLAGLAILAGHAGRRGGRHMLVALTLAWAGGVLFGYLLAPAQWQIAVATAGVILLVGVMGAVKLRISPDILVWGAGVVGLGRGLLNGSALAAAGGSWLSVLGVITGVFVLGAMLTAGSTWLATRRGAVLLRVAASWVAAVGLLMLGWELRE